MWNDLKGLCLAVLGFSCAIPVVGQSVTPRLRSDIESLKPGSAFMEKYAPEQAPMLGDLNELLRSRFALGPNDEFRPSKNEQAILGDALVTLQQYHLGRLVVGGVLKAQVREGRITVLNGRVMPVGDDGQVIVDAESALAAAISQSGAGELMWQDAGQEAFVKKLKQDPAATWKPKPELVYVMDQLGEGSECHLAWKMDVYSQRPLFRADLYVDAATGDLIFRNDRLSTADAHGVGHTYYSGVRNIVTDSTAPNSYRLREAGRAQGVETYDLQNGTDYNQAVDFLDSNNLWNNVQFPIENAGLDAHWGAEMTFDYFSIFHGRDSYDDSASKLISYVSYDNGYANAFWNGIFMTYGDGGGNNNPFQGLDVCGHEFTHGVTEYAAGLVYQDEPGALNESFSDIFGNTIEFWARPNNASWRIGDDIGAFRSMQDPAGYLNPDTYKGTYWAVGTWDNGGVHTNSGVQNHWYYLLSDGGSGVNDNGDAFSVSGIGIDSAAAIAYRNLQVYLTPFDGYAEARKYSIEAAIDLFGECSNEMIQTIKAWYAVGVGLPYTGTLVADFYSPDTNQCNFPVDVRFFNHSQSALYYLWDFGDGQTSTLENPVHTYNSAGDFTVRLISIGCNGTADTLTMPNRIHIDLNQPCTVNLPTGGDTLLLTACDGNLFDSGGADDYLNDSHGRITILPGGNNQVQVTFSTFHYAAGDRLTAYDGPDNQSPVIGVYVGSTLPAPITSTSGALTLQESTNGATTHFGFTATWACVPTVGVDVAQGSCRIFPNPTAGLLRVEWEDADGADNEVQVLDGLGRLCHHDQGVHQQNWTKVLDLTNLPAGIYTLRLRAGAEIVTQKLIVQ